MEGIGDSFYPAIGGGGGGGGGTVDSVFHSNSSLEPSLKTQCENLPPFYSEVIMQAMGEIFGLVRIDN